MPPTAELRRNRLTLLILWLLFYASFTLFTPPLLDDADSVHAEVAREMLLRHDWVTLYANGIRYLEKAPLFYWSEAASMKLLGPTTAASRLPLSFAVLALTLLCESFARRAFCSTRAGLYAGLITLSSFGIFIFSRINIPDVMVCVFLTLALYAYYLTEQQEFIPGTNRHPERSAQRAVEGPRSSPPRLDRLKPPTQNHFATEAPGRALCCLFAAALALNILTKGLIGIVFPVAIVLAHLLLTRGPRGTLRRLLQFHPIASTATLLLIAVPWHILIALANPTQGHPGGVALVNGHWQVPLPTDGNVHGWTWFYFINEQVLRYLNLRVPRDYDTVPLWLFWGLCLIWLMPWSAFLFHAVARAFPITSSAFRARLRTRTFLAFERTHLLLILWAALPLLFFSLSTRQEYYVLPSLPPLILLIAGWLHRANIWNSSGETTPSTTTSQTMVFFSVDPELFEVSAAGIAATRLSTLLLALGSLLTTICLYLILHTRTPAPGTDLSTLLQQNPGNYALSFGHFLDLNAHALGLFRLPLALTALAFFAGTLAHFLLRRNGRPHGATLALASGAFLFLVASWLGLRTFSPTLTSHQLAQAIAPQLTPQDLIVLHGEYEAGSTLGFYLHRNDLHILEGRSSNLWYGSFFPDAPKIFETRASLAAKWPGPQRIFLWEDPHDPDRPVLKLPQPVYVIAKGGGKYILSNQPNIILRHESVPRR